MTNFPSTISHVAGAWGNGGSSEWRISTNPTQNLTDNSIKHYDLYDVPSGSTYPNNGIQFVLNGSSTEVHVEGTGDLGAPTSVAVGSTYNSQTSVTIADGDTVSFWAGASTRYFSMSVTSSMLFSTGGGGTSTEGSSYSGTLTVSGTSLEYEIPVTSSSGTYELKADGTIQLSIVHGSTASIGSAPNFDQTKIWTLISPMGDELDEIDLTGSGGSLTKKVFCNFW